MKQKMPWQENPPVDPFKKRAEPKATQDEGWLLSLKKLAAQNIDDPRESLRIAWQHRWKRPLYESFEDYSLEEAIVELWEQHFYENPKAIETKGVFKKRNPKTGYAYYETGDPLIDELERLFSEGIVPDLDKAFGHIGKGEDIFRAKVFVGEDGQPVAARRGLEGTVKTETGEHRTISGATVHHDDYTKEDWMMDDPLLKSLKEKMGV